MGEGLVDVGHVLDKNRWLLEPGNNRAAQSRSDEDVYFEAHGVVGRRGFPGRIKGIKGAIWVFPKIGVPQNGWFIMENPITF